MNNTNEPVGIGKGLSTLERSRFGPGMLLHHEDLEQLNIYTRSLSRLYPLWTPPRPSLASPSGCTGPLKPR